MGNSFFGSRLKFGDLMSDLSYSFTQREVGRGARKSDQVWLPFGSCDLYRHDRPWLLAGKACLPLTYQLAAFHCNVVTFICASSSKSNTSNFIFQR